jgi:hypothetical protein
MLAALCNLRSGWAENGVSIERFRKGLAGTYVVRIEVYCVIRVSQIPIIGATAPPIKILPISTSCAATLAPSTTVPSSSNIISTS